MQFLFFVGRTKARSKILFSNKTKLFFFSTSIHNPDRDLISSSIVSHSMQFLFFVGRTKARSKILFSNKTKLFFFSTSIHNPDRDLISSSIVSHSMQFLFFVGRTKARSKILFSNKTKLFFFSTSIHNPDRDLISSSIVSHYFSLLTSSPSLHHLRQIHARLLVTSLYNHVILSSRLVFMYSRHNKLRPDSLSVFFHMPNRNIFSWNIIIGEFCRSRFPEKSIDLFLHMWSRECREDVRPDDYSFPLVLRACAAAGFGKLGVSLHGLCVKMGWERSLFVASALVFMYVTFGDVMNARVLFDEMPRRDAVLWTAMIAGYAQHGEPMLGLQVFRGMVNAGVELDWVVMVSLLSVCGQLGWLKHGKSVHGWCLRNCLSLDLSLGNAIVDLYVKCASLSYAHRMFNEMRSRDVFSWSSLILGYGMNGNVTSALDLFDRMGAAGVRPNGVTFLGLLSACAHGGLVERANLCFESMQDYGITAELSHYAAMVDCLGRAGFLNEAERFIVEMPIEPDAAVFGAILSGCRVHNNVEVGERIAKKLICLEPKKAGYYVLLSNIYSAAGRAEEAEAIRYFMKEKYMLKVPGHSLIESKDYSSHSLD